MLAYVTLFTLFTFFSLNLPILISLFITATVNGANTQICSKIITHTNENFIFDKILTFSTQKKIGCDLMEKPLARLRSTR